ncbi:MAG: PP2C family protein-serine/threonine phosphatase [Ignavibacteriales bacterium]|nr:PP2C family protein-serine/threonine phosphatase [Ignavibacteriales bacterium]
MSSRQKKQSKIKGDLHSLKEFYIDDSQKERIQKMGKVRRWFNYTWWVFKGMINKLTHTRRIMVIVATIFILIEVNADSTSFDFDFWGYVILIIVLMLELKDKLLAKDELQAGRAIQEALLPIKNPKIPGWDIWLYSQPANDVGGDLIDFIEIGNSKYAITLGDVSGKGLPAALLMAKLQSTIKAVIPFSKSNHDLMKKVNEIFYKYGLKKNFASLVYLTFEQNSNKIKLVNAGHLPPLIIKSDKIEELPRGGPAIGLLPNLEASEHSLEINDNEVFIIYSDGVTESRNETEQFFGLEKFKEYLRKYRNLSAENLGEKILLNISRFIGNTLPYDDLSMIILRKTKQ